MTNYNNNAIAYFKRFRPKNQKLNSNLIFSNKIKTTKK